jgi:RecG-like helicase
MPAQRERAFEFLRSECGRGRQAYVVLPVIEESERADLRAATTMAQTLAARYCILLADGPGLDRLQAFAATHDGFKIAEMDLEERGMGDLIGARQSGGFEVRHARLPADTDLLTQARALAIRLIETDPALQRPENPRLRARAVSRYPRAVELFRVG